MEAEITCSDAVIMHLTGDMPELDVSDVNSAPETEHLLILEFTGFPADSVIYI